ncbi:Leucine-rich repeat-containing protein 23 [Kappamyces sp. JEL0829]|nr:Leucine-rich repeat-containing protein 23 [Kappamyces sp. JEL0829]
MDDDTQPTENPVEFEAENAAVEESPVSAEDPAPYAADAFPLTPELISQHISLIARTANGVSHAFTRLEIHDSEITNLASLQSFPHLRYIDCSDNHLVDIEEATGLEYLLSLNVQNNFISTLPAGLDKKKYLQHLNLAKNRLRDKDWTITSLPLLTFLNLNENKFTENIPLESLGELVHLELRANKLKSAPARLAAPKLQRLYLAANEISTVSLGDLTALQVLNLRGNKIETLDGLDKLENLTYLNLRSNKIENQDELVKLQKNTKLRVVVFTDNPIAAIDNYRIDMITKLPKLDRIDKEPVSQEERDEVFESQKAADEKDE